MSTALNIGLIVVSFVGILWCLYFLAVKIYGARKEKPVVARKAAPAQPWASDKSGGRGNR